MKTLTLKQIEANHYQRMEAVRNLDYWIRMMIVAERKNRMYSFGSKADRYTYCQERVHYWTKKLEELGE